MILELTLSDVYSSSDVCLYDNKYNATVKSVEQLKKVLDKINGKIDYIYIDNFVDCLKYKEILEYIKDRLIFDFSSICYEDIIKYIKENELYEYRFIVDYSDYKEITYDQIIKINNYINQIVNYVKKFNLSSYEQTLFLSDLIREERYKKSNLDKEMKNPKDLSISRDLSSLLTNDEIVCEGYANIFSACLTKLGFSNSKLYYYHGDDSNLSDEEKKVAHAANICEIKDDKYNINGMFTYDLTWVSNKDNNYLYNYNYLGLPYEYDVLAKKAKYRFDENNSMIETPIQTLLKRIQRANYLQTNNAPNTVIQREFRLIKDGFNQCYSDNLKSSYKFEYDKYYNKYPKDPLKGLIEYYDCIKDLCIKEIPDDVFIKALYNVKRVEFSIDKEKYDLDINKIIDSANDRYRFNKGLKTKTNLSNVLVGYKSKKEMLLDYLFNTIDEDLEENTLEDIKKNILVYNDVDKNKFKDEDSEVDEFYLDKNRMELISVLRKISKIDTLNPVLKRRK